MEKKEFRVVLEKEKYFTGEIIVEASSEAEAKKIAFDRIANCTLSSTDIEWEECEYLNSSFGVCDAVCVESYDVFGDFVSTWSDGSSTETTALLAVSTGIFISTTKPDDTIDRGSLESEVFIDGGKEYKVCPKCHGAIMVYEINGDTVLEEKSVCADESCGYTE